MKHFLIKYEFKGNSEAEWHQEIARFIAALDDDPELAGKISYRCLKHRTGTDCYHLATAVDDAANATLRERDFFVHYTARAKAAGGGTVEVLPLELIAATRYQP